MDPSLWLRLPGKDFQLWPVVAPLPPGSISEAREHILELRNAPDSLTAELYVDGLKLEGMRPPDLHTARWCWDPEFYAGSVQIQLEPEPGKRHLFETLVDPDRRKLNRQNFDQMVSDILEDSQALFALSSYRTGVARGLHRPPLPVARLEYLLSRVPRIVAVIEAINARPQRVLRGHEEARPWHRARGVTGPELARSLRRGDVLRETVSPGRLPPVLGGHMPQVIRQTRRTDVFDTPEHRMIRAALLRWSGFLGVMASEYTALSNREDHKLAGIWAARAGQASARLRKLLDLSVFLGVAERQDMLKVTSVFRNVAPYRNFLHLYRDFQRGLAGITGDFLNVPLARTFDLYEQWCFLRLLRAAHELGLVEINAPDTLFSSESGVNDIRLTGGDILIPLRGDRAIVFQRTFREYWMETPWLTGAPPRGTFSRDMRPDIALASVRGIVVLDSKYRIGSNLNDSLSSIHTYRDALVEMQGSDVQRSVRAAYLLTPAEPALSHTGDWKAASLPGRLFHPVYRTEFRFGALTFRPGMNMKDVTDALELLLKDADR